MLKGGTEKFAAVLWDLKYLFDHINHEELWRKVCEWGYPKKLARLAINQFRACRHLQINSKRAEDVFPERSVFTGHGLAMSLIHVYSMGPLDNPIRKINDVAITVYVDDITMAAVGHDENDVATKFERASRAMLHTVEQGLKSKVAWPKAALTASDKHT